MYFNVYIWCYFTFLHNSEVNNVLFTLITDAAGLVSALQIDLHKDFACKSSLFDELL